MVADKRRFGTHSGVGFPNVLVKAGWRCLNGVRYNFSNCSVDSVIEVGTVVSAGIAVPSWDGDALPWLRSSSPALWSAMVLYVED